MEIEGLTQLITPSSHRAGVHRGTSSKVPGEARARAAGPSTARGGSGAATGVVLELSARAVAASANPRSASETARDDRGEGPGATAEDRLSGSSGSPDSYGSRPGELSLEEQEKVREMKARDAEVRAHENAHKAAAGRHARGGPRFEFERGPDGRRYAVGGEVSIDTSAVPNDPDATILKMQQVRRAALAPAEPSSQDRKVVSQASRTEASARAEKLAESRDAGSSSLVDRYTNPVEETRGSELDLIA